MEDFLNLLVLILLFLGIPAKLIAFVISRFFRFWILLVHAYPPEHCDADGDFKQIKDDNKTSN